MSAHRYARRVAGLGTVVASIVVLTVAGGLFRGSFTQTVPVTVLSPRAGLVMDPGAEVKLRGVPVGKVASIELRPNGHAALHLAMNPSQLHFIPTNVLVDITSSTIFGNKFVDLVPPAEPSAKRMHAGQVLDGKHVVVEFNTIFEQLTSLLAKIEPEKLNETLGAIASGLNGRGHSLGQALADLDGFLAALEPGLPALSHDITVLPAVLNAYADATPNVLTTLQNSSRISQTVVDEQNNLDALLISAIGLGDIGDDVVRANRRPLTDVLHLMVPTTDLNSQYSHGINCSLAGLIPLAKAPPSPVPGAYTGQSSVLGIERYRYPKDLPKVAATGGPHCMDLPNVPSGKREPFLVTDVGANPWQYGNQGILLNSNALKQWLFGPIDGPDRIKQIGQPG